MYYSSPNISCYMKWSSRVYYLRLNFSFRSFGSGGLYHVGDKFRSFLHEFFVLLKGLLPLLQSSTHQILLVFVHVVTVIRDGQRIVYSIIDTTAIFAAYRSFTDKIIFDQLKKSCANLNEGNFLPQNITSVRLRRMERTQWKIRPN